MPGFKLGSNVETTDGPKSLTVVGVRVFDPGSGKERGIAAFGGTNDVVLEDFDAANFYLNGIKNFTVRGGDWGPCTASANPSADGCSNSKIDGNAANDNIVVEDAVFHDYRIVIGSGAHFECMFLVSGTNITIRRNRFVNCEFYDIFLQNFSGLGPLTGIVIENNHFDVPWNGSGSQSRNTAIEFSPRRTPFTNVLVRFNSFHPDTGVNVNGDGDGTVYSNFRLVGNLLGSNHGCYPSATYVRNLRKTAPCAATELQVTDFGYVNNAKGVAFDPHLLATSPALGFVTESGGDFELAHDFDRDLRVAPRDVGSDER